MKAILSYIAILIVSIVISVVIAAVFLFLTENVDLSVALFFLGGLMVFMLLGGLD